jgi:hypothetical protein
MQLFYLKQDISQHNIIARFLFPISSNGPAIYDGGGVKRSRCAEGQAPNGAPWELLC